MAGRLRPPALRLIAGLLLLAGVGAAASPTDEVPPADGEDLSDPGGPPVPLPAFFATVTALNVRREPDGQSPRRGLLLTGAVVKADRWRGGEGCREGWLGLPGSGWICAGLVEPTTDRPSSDHAMVAFDPPTPAERAEYLRTGAWDREVDDPPDLLPWIYGRRGGRFAGRLYASVAAKEAGEESIGQLLPGRAHHFVAIEETADGALLVLPDGRVAPLDEVRLYASSRFEGVAIDHELPAWVRRGGANLRSEPGANVEAELSPRDVLWLSGEERVVAGQTWLDVSRPQEGWVAANRVRRVRLLPPPEGVDGGWLDVDLAQQVIVAQDVDGATYATLVSAGAGVGRATPLGLFRLSDKMLHWDMASLEDADDPYHVEEVPFVMHFWPRFALHTAFWHDGFGDPRSHGCINLAPADARTIFGLTAPDVHPGWHSAWESPDEPGTLLRIHRGSATVPDRREPIR